MTDILDQNNPNHATGEISGAYGTFGGGNSFTTGEGVTNISKLTHWCWTNAGGAGDTYVQIYLDSDLSLVGTSDVKDASTLSTSAADNSWVWSTPLTLLPNTVYRWILRYPNGAEGNSIHIYGQTPSCYAGGIYWQEDSGNWLPLANYDTDFKTYYKPTTTIEWLNIDDTQTPTNAFGNKGDICYDADNIYVCVADNTWKKAALAVI